MSTFHATSVALVVFLLLACSSSSSGGSGAPGGSTGAQGSATYSEIAVGTAGGCVVRRGDGRVICWTSGGVTVSDDTLPLTKKALEVVAAKGAHGLSIGREACGIGKDGVLCWTLPMGFDAGASQPTIKTIALANVAALAVGKRHSCAVAGGNVTCWGDNEYGALGDGTKTAHESPVAVMGLSGATSVAVSEVASCVVTDAAKVFCWGGFDFTRTPQEVPELAGAAAVGLMGDGDLARAVCALRGDGTITCAGPPEGVRALCKASQGLCAGGSDSFTCTAAPCPPDVDPKDVPRQEIRLHAPGGGARLRSARPRPRLLAWRRGIRHAVLPRPRGRLLRPGGSVRAYAMALDTDGGRYCSIAAQLQVREGQPVFEGEHVTCPGMGYVQKGNTTTCGSPPEIALPP